MASPQTDVDGLSVVFTPIQLAASLQAGTVTRAQTMGNRFWGALSVIGGALDMVATVPLWVAPDPTMATKAAAGGLDYIGADIAWTGMKQVWTGRQQKTFIAEVVERSLNSLGVDPEMADQLSHGTDIAFNIAAAIAAPLAVSKMAQAARITSIERGLIKLEVEETYPGAHTIRDHVGKTLPELQARFAQIPWLKKSSTFRSLHEAEVAVTDAIAHYANDIQAWAALAKVGEKENWVYDTGSVVGHTLLEGSSVLQDANKVLIVLRKTADLNKVYYVLTACPEL